MKFSFSLISHLSVVTRTIFISSSPVRIDIHGDSVAAKCPSVRLSVNRSVTKLLSLDQRGTTPVAYKLYRIRPCFARRFKLVSSPLRTGQHHGQTRLDQGHRHLRCFSTTQQNYRVSITRDGKETGDKLQRRDVVENDDNRPK